MSLTCSKSACFLTEGIPTNVFSASKTIKETIKLTHFKSFYKIKASSVSCKKIPKPSNYEN